MIRRRKKRNKGKREEEKQRRRAECVLERGSNQTLGTDLLIY